MSIIVLYFPKNYPHVKKDLNKFRYTIILIQRKKLGVHLFDFLESDWFNIGLQIVFIIALVYDIKKYTQTHKKEYIVNIVATIGFAVWILYPYYISYSGWNEKQKLEMISHCSGDKNSTKLCRCLDNASFKSYTHDEYLALDKNASEYKEWFKDTKEDCLDDGWF